MQAQVTANGRGCKPQAMVPGSKFMLEASERCATALGAATVNLCSNLRQPMNEITSLLRDRSCPNPLAVAQPVRGRGSLQRVPIRKGSAQPRSPRRDIPMQVRSMDRHVGLHTCLVCRNLASFSLATPCSARLGLCSLTSSPE